MSETVNPETVNPAPLIRRILAFVEFTERREPEMSYAIAMAKQLGAELILFGVIDTPAMVSMIGKHRAVEKVAPTLTDNLVEEAKLVLQEIVDAAAKQGVRARGHATVSEEVPELILREATVQQVDLILLRSHGGSSVLKALLGSTVEEILKAAPCPVLVARA